jgi:putative transcriptional regulator
MSSGGGPANAGGPEVQPHYLAGYFLVSDIDLRDPNFYRSVVLTISHDDNGALGLVVNRPSPLSLGQMVEGLRDTAAASIPVFVGGPVQQEILFCLHGDLPGLESDDEAMRPLDGVYFEPLTRAMISYLEDEWSSRPVPERAPVRLYAGYSGWGPGQLEGELRAGAWIVVKGTSEITFHPEPAQGWADAFARNGPLSRIILQTGFKPSMN